MADPGGIVFLHFIQEILDDSYLNDQNEESSEPELWLLLLNKMRPICHIPKVLGFVEHVIPNYLNIDFRRDFRISQDTFHSLFTHLKPALQYHEYSGFGHEGLSVEKQILLFLWYLSNQDSMREVSRLFGVSKSTVHKCVRRVSEAIFNIRAEIIKWPDLNRQDEISRSVEQSSKIPNVIGFVDGTHIRLTQTPHADYINRKGYPSINVQIIVDDRLLVTDVHAGWPGCTHDARIFRNSPIFEALQTGTVPLGENKFLIGKQAWHLNTSRPSLVGLWCSIAVFNVVMENDDTE